MNSIIDQIKTHLYLLKLFGEQTQELLQMKIGFPIDLQQGSIELIEKLLMQVLKD